MVSLIAPSTSCDGKCVIAMYMPKTNMPLKCGHINHMCSLVHVHIWDNYVSIYASYEPSAISNVSRNTDIHNFTLLVFAPEQNMTVKFHINVPLYYYWDLNTDLHYCNMQVLKKSATATPHTIVKYVPESNIPLKCHIHATYTNYFMYTC